MWVWVCVCCVSISVCAYVSMSVSMSVSVSTSMSVSVSVSVSVFANRFLSHRLRRGRRWQACGQQVGGSFQLRLLGRPTGVEVPRLILGDTSVDTGMSCLCDLWEYAYGVSCVCDLEEEVRCMEIAGASLILGGTAVDTGVAFLCDLYRSVCFLCRVCVIAWCVCHLW